MMHVQVQSRPVTGSRRSISYLLRLWQEDPLSPWRAMLRDVRTKEEHVFPDLDGLVAYLKTEGSAKQAPRGMDETDGS